MIISNINFALIYVVFR